MIAIDTNILVYAHRDHFPAHHLAVRWLSHLSEGTIPWALPVFCLGEFLRVVTHAKVLAPPSTLEEATSALTGLLKSPSIRLLQPGASYAELLFEALRVGQARGNLVFDAQIAALCREHGVSRLLTSDRDFARFAPLQLLRLEDPLPT